MSTVVPKIVLVLLRCSLGARSCQAHIQECHLFTLKEEDGLKKTLFYEKRVHSKNCWFILTGLTGYKTLILYAVIIQ